MDTIKFSILIPAYKGKFLKEAIESIVNQTYNNWELIIVDDCSPENIKQIASPYINEKVFYFRNEKNFGAVNVVDNWNKCLGYATGDYVICMGDDDVLLPECLKIYKNLIYTYPDLDVYHGLTEIIDDKGSIIDIQESRPILESTYSLIWHRWKGRKQYIGDFLFRKSKLKEIGGFYKLPLAWGSDDLSAVIMADKKGIANTQYPVFCYRMSAITISNSGNSEIKMCAIANEIKWYEDFFYFTINNHNQIIDDMSMIYINLCRKMMVKHFIKKKSHIMSEDMRGNLLRIFKWLKNSSRYGVPRFLVIYSFLKALRDTLSVRYQSSKS